MYSFENKKIIITGINGILGKAIVQHFKNLGAGVCGMDLGEYNPESGVNETGYCSCDIANKDTVDDAMVSLMSETSVEYILVNNAGISTPEPFEERTDEQFDRVMAVNAKGSFHCIQSYVKCFDKVDCSKGAIVNIASIFGVISPDFRNYCDYNFVSPEVYGMSKAGVIQMTRYFAVALAKRNIRVNSVSPGGLFNKNNPQGDEFIKRYSDRVPMNRMGNPEEMVGAIAYFASDVASYTTGQNMVIDGGLSAW